MITKLLIDANLSWRLVSMLRNTFPEIMHISNVGLDEDTPDYKIWSYALQNDYSIVTNDEDFYLLSMSKGFPPHIILLRTGNQSTRYIAEILTKHKTEVIDFTSSNEYGVLEIF